MNKDIKDYIHLYYGQYIYWRAIGRGEFCHGIIDDYIIKNISELEIKWPLRHLSDMTEEEQDYRWNNFINIKVINQEVVAEEIRWLLSKQFDLFNLIHEGLAIDKTKLQSK